MRTTLNLIFLLYMLCFTFSLQAQRFKAAALLGINASQIDGDNLYGFDKAGISAGARLSYDNDKSMDYAIEMLYSQRGSATKLINNGPGDKISLSYIELPVIISFRDWYIEDKEYYKVRAEGGLSYGYLFRADAVGFDTDSYRKHDISWLLGVGINFTKTWGMGLRYTSSFTDLYKDTPNEIKFKSYFITLRSEINF